MPSDAAIIAASAATQAIAEAVTADRQYKMALLATGDPAIIAALTLDVELDVAERESWFNLFEPLRTLINSGATS